MNELDIIGQEETEPDLGSVVRDTLYCISAELDRIKARTGERYASAYESYSVLMKALEDRTAIEKDLKDAVKQLWDGVKREDDDVVAAFLKEIERVARDSAIAWIHIAAIAQKAEESLD